MKLSTSRRTPKAGRLGAVAAMVPVGSRVADIGTDAALLPRLLLRGGIASHCVACDVAEKGLDTARRLCRREIAAGSLTLRRASGLEGLDLRDEVDVWVLSGLGGRTIVRILDRGRSQGRRAARLVLQPQSEVAVVRRWLFGHGYAVVDEALARERDRDYVILAAEPLPDAAASWRGPLPLEDLLQVGPRLITSRDPRVRDHWQREYRRQTRILDRCRNFAEAPLAARRRELALRVLASLPPGPGTPRGSARDGTGARL